MRILYVDTGLRFPDGHIVSSAISLPPAFRRLGHKVTILGHRDLAPSLQQAIGAYPFFQTFTWWMESRDPLVGWLVDFIPFVEATVADLHRAWREFGPFDFVYVNTARPVQLAATALWLKDGFPDQDAAPVVAVQLGTTPGLSRSEGPEGPSFTMKDPSTMLHRYATNLVGREWMQKLALVAVNKTIAEEYSFIVDLPVMPITAPEELPTPRQRKPGKTLTIGFMGHQRIDKGYEFLPDLIALLLRRHGHLRFIVQHSDPDGRSQAEPERMARVTTKLRALADQADSLELILQPAIGDEWFALIDRCDIVALPYEPANYTDSYSAIFGEALASGAVIVAPAGTTMADEIARAGGVGTTFEDWTVASIAMAIDAVIVRFEDLAKRAHAGGLVWRKHHGPDAYVSSVIDAAKLSGDTGAARIEAARSKRFWDLGYQLLPDDFLRNPKVQNGAFARQRLVSDLTSASTLGRWLTQAQHKLGRHRQAPILNTEIETSRLPFDYALIFDVDIDAIHKMPRESYLSVDLVIEVNAGRVGVVWIDEGYQLSSSEKTVGAKRGAQHVVVSVLARRAHGLVLRNVDTEGAATVFTVRWLSVKAMSGVRRQGAFRSSSKDVDLSLSSQDLRQA